MVIMEIHTAKNQTIITTVTHTLQESYKCLFNLFIGILKY